MVLWKRCCVTQWLRSAPGSPGDARYNPNAPHFKAPTWLFVFASTLKYWPLLPNCSLGKNPWGSSTHCGTAARHCCPMNRGHHAATVKICLLLHTVKLYHGKVIKWAVINYFLSWKREFKIYCFCFQIHNYLEFYTTYVSADFFLSRTCLWC